MLHIRVVKTKGMSSSVQVFRYENSKRVIIKHIGSGTTDEQINALRSMAQSYIDDFTKQLYLFEELKPSETTVLLSQCNYIGITYGYVYDVLCTIQRNMGYTPIIDSLLRDLVVIRIFEPCSKLRSIELMNTYFGIKHRRQRYYESAPNWLLLKDQIERKTVEFAKKEYGFDYSLVFYDVTTLYFEAFVEDELRKNGFSKDNKAMQPQIVVALMVTPDGFPIGYEVFAGNTFEGHTFIPVIEAFSKKYSVNNFTVIADAAMISDDNIKDLELKKINYIVGARMGSLSKVDLATVDKAMLRKDQYNIRVQTNKGTLICSYSQNRYHKDKYEMTKQVEKAKSILNQPSKQKRVKFITSTSDKIELNNALIEKTQKLLGIKGYYTNLDDYVVDNNTIIKRYHDLYKIEQAFRISKNDLQTRPIFHFKEQPIKLHMLICFMALAVSKHIELKGQLSIRAFLTEAKKITDANLINKISNKKITMRCEVPIDLHKTVLKIIRPH